jgi:hypothetical protein
LDSQEVTGDIFLGNGTANFNKVDIATTRAQVGYDGNAYVNSASKDIELRSASVAGLIMTTLCSVLLGRPSPATTATDGFPYLPVMAGTPTGVPTSKTGFVPAVIDSSGSKLWVYVGGSWKSTTLA